MGVATEQRTLASEDFIFLAKEGYCEHGKHGTLGKTIGTLQVVSFLVFLPENHLG